MSQSLAHVTVHLVFSTKDRQRFLVDDELREEMHRQLGGVSKALGCPPLRVGGVEDHVHLVGSLGRSISLAEWVKELKRTTSRWIKEHAPSCSSFGWQSGYGAFSVSHSEIDRVVDYVERQREHHRIRDFQAEHRLLLERHNVPYDERYVWD